MSVLTAPWRFATLLVQSILLALAQIWANKTRSVLTTIGIVIGVAAVTTVIAALSGLRQTVLDEFESIGTNKIFIFPRATQEMRRTGVWRDIIFADDLFEELTEEAPAVGNYTRQSDLTLDVTYEGLKTSVQVTGIDPSWHDVQNRLVTLGRPFSFVDAQQGTPVALVNQDAIDSFGLDRDPTGNVISIGPRRFRIVGVVEDAAELGMFGGPPGAGEEGVEVFIPFASMRRLAPNNGYYAIATSVTTEQAPEAAAQLRYLMRKRRGIGFDDEENFGIEYVQRFVDQFMRLAWGVTAVASAIVAISLIVGGVGIMNIMLVSVSERTREIGLRKAVGARPAAILLQFLVEAVVLCLVGGAMGVLGGELLTAGLRAAAAAFDFGAAGLFIPWWAMALSFGFCAFVGVIFGMWPAWKASRLDPIDALRHE